MTKEEMLVQLKYDRDLCNFNPSTGESEPISEDCRKSAEALDMAIKLIEQQPCDDCVSRAQALKELKESAEHHANDSREEVLLRRDRDIIRALPPVTPTRKAGKWILIDEEENVWQCSHCKELGKDDWWHLNSGTPQDNKMDYCPHCGAEMRNNKNEGN